MNILKTGFGLVACVALVCMIVELQPTSAQQTDSQTPGEKQASPPAKTDAPPIGDLPPAKQPNSQPPVTADPADAVGQAVGAAIKTDPRLQGAWIDVSIDTAKKVVLQPIFDPQKLKEQEEGLRALVTKLTTDGVLQKDGYVLATSKQRAPVSKLLAGLQALIDAPGSDLAGCRIYSAEFAPQLAGGKALTLSLNGYVTQEESDRKLNAIAQHAVQAIQNDADWKTLVAQRGGAAIVPVKTAIQLVSPDSDKLTKAVRERIATALMSDAKLHGAWIDSVATVPLTGGAPTIVLNAILDTDVQAATVQRAAVDNLVKRLVEDDVLTAGRFELTWGRPRPVQRLLTELAKLVSSDEALNNCLVNGGYFAAGPDAASPQELILRGRVTGDAAKKLVAAKCDELLKKAPVWSVVKASGEGLTVISPASKGQALFDQIVAALKKDAALHGAWVDVMVDLDDNDLAGTNPKFTLAPVFDTDKARAAIQKKAFDALLKSLVDSKVLPMDHKLATARSRPLIKLLKDLNAKEGMQNSVVSNAYFEPLNKMLAENGRNSLSLILVGRVAKEGQQEQVAVLTQNLLAAAPVWAGVAPDKDLLKVVDPSQYRGSVVAGLSKAVMDEAVLHGARIDVEVGLSQNDPEGDDPVFTFLPVFDADTEAAQLASLKKLIPELIGKRQFTIADSQTVPFTKLLAAIQKAMETSGILDNCTVCDAYFELEKDSADGSTLTLVGRVTREEQRETVARIVTAELAKMPAVWTGVIPKKDDLKLVVPSATAMTVWKPYVDAVKSDDGLRGTWVNVEVRYDWKDCVGDTPKFLIKPIFDSDKAREKVQRARFDAILKTLVTKKILGSKSYEIVDQTARPLKQLLSDLQEAIEKPDSGLKNCLVYDAHFAPVSPQLGDDGESAQFLVLQGRVTREDQKETIIRLAAQLMAADPVWNSTAPTSQTVEIAYLDEDDAAAKKADPSKKDPAKKGPSPAEKKPVDSPGGQVTASKEAIVIVDPAMYEVDVRAKLVATVADAPELRGAWIEVSAILLREDREGDDPKFIFQPMLDSDEQETQQPAAEALIKSLVGDEKSSYEIAKPKLRPVGRLMEQLQDQVERVAGLEGVLITHGTFRPGPDVSAPVLAFRGRVVRAEQQALVLQVFDAFVEGREACWQPQGDGIAGGAEKLVSVEPSDFAASWFFCHGMEAYRDGDFEEAHVSFRRANVEIEGSSSYQYWMAVCELEMDQTDRAAGRLEPILWRVRKSSRGGEYGAILSSLEKCQGDVRRELRRVELEVLKRLPDPEGD